MLQAVVLPLAGCSPPARDARMKERLFLEVEAASRDSASPVLKLGTYQCLGGM